MMLLGLITGGFLPGNLSLAEEVLVIDIVGIITILI